MAFDDLIKGLAVFNQGVKELAISHATNDANEQLNELNTQQLGREEQLKAQSAIGNSLALRLQSAGADGADIAATASRLSPSAGEMYQVQAAQDQQSSTQKFQLGLKREEMKNAKDIAQMKIDALQGKAGKAQQKVVLGFGKELDKKPDFAPYAKGVKPIDDALEQVKSTKGQFGATAMINLAQLGLIRTAAGRVNEKEIEGANESPSARAKLWKSMGLQVTGEVPLNVQDFWTRVLQRAHDNAKIHMRDQIRGFAKEKEILTDGDISADMVEKAMNQRYNLEPSTPQASPSPASTPAAPKAPGLPAGFSAIGQ